MKKETFLRQLCRRLNRLKREERVQVIESFREMISDRMEEGLSEEEAVACLGTPKEAAQEILNGMPEEKLLKKDRLGPVLLILFLIAGGLSLFWAVRIRLIFRLPCRNRRRRWADQHLCGGKAGTCLGALRRRGSFASGPGGASVETEPDVRSGSVRAAPSALPAVPSAPPPGNSWCGRSRSPARRRRLF